MSRTQAIMATYTHCDVMASWPLESTMASIFANKKFHLPKRAMDVHIVEYLELRHLNQS